MSREMSQTPLKVSAITKERIRLGAAVEGITHGAFVEKAIEEFIEHHKGELKDGIQKAAETLGIDIKID